jgi:hypothetical protein
MMVVQVEKPDNITLAEWFAELRLWLDDNDCHPTLFNEAEQVIDALSFNLTFSNDAEAQLFACRFSHYAAKIMPLASNNESAVATPL